jgi:GPH family glycoside/pentoside/hexuronide:cation symporter
MQSKGLTMKTKLGFGVTELGSNLFFTMMGIHLMRFFTDTAQLGALLAGIALWIGKICDAITDPTVGYLSDRTRSKWGRRRPWMFVGAILLLLTMILQFTNPHLQNNQTALFIWMTLAWCLLTTAYTMVNIPYCSLIPELASDFHERTILNAYRTAFAIGGTALGSIGVASLLGFYADKNTGWTIAGAVMGTVMLVTALITVFVIKEPKDSATLAMPEKGLLKQYLSAFKQKPVRFALFPWLLHITGITVIQTVLIYYFTYIYNNEGAFNYAFAFLLGSSLIFVPVCTLVSKKIGKKLTYNIGMGIFAAAVLVFFFVGNGRGEEIMYATMAVAGIGLSTQYVMPYALVPDIVDYDFIDRGENREGIFFSMWTFMSKVGQALAFLITGTVLWLFGYVPNAAQTDLSKLGLRLMMGPIPTFFFVAGMVILSFYPITRTYYDTVIKPKVAARKRKV